MYNITVSGDYFMESFVKLSLSSLFSFMLGFEREYHTHPGGVCTHTLVGLGSCLYTMISLHIRDNYESVNSDPARICAQIVSGMGFLGSATIFKSENYVKGINTAANLWISAAVSMAIGADMWEFAFLTTIFSVIVLIVNHFYKKCRYEKEKKKKKTSKVLEMNNLDRDPLDAPYGDENKDI